ncbi:hypothetical protein [Amycolatopsis nigrescens]|uniref:hypothetical protein n=1 Tax=Amycolatopsis nigrescens TaxID=381445 RepID=UPI0012F77199|nr:hypothetical protein [Amycolatopsis nigrescens]
MRMPVPGRINGGFGFPLGFAVTGLTAVAAVAAGGTGHPDAALAALCGAAAVVAVLTTLPAAFGTAAMAWACHSGFVLGRAGELVWTPAAGRAAVILLVTAAAAHGCGLALHHARQRVRRSGPTPARRAATAAVMRGRPAG